MQCSGDGIGRMDGDWVRFANTGPFSPLLLWRLPKAHTGSATILVDELHQGYRWVGPFWYFLRVQAARCALMRFAICGFSFRLASFRS